MMAAVAPHPMSRVLSATQGEIPSVFMQFFGELCSSPIVQRVGVSDEAIEGLHVWVRLDVDDEEQEERMYRSLQAYRASDQGMPVDLHVVLATQPDETFPADAHVLYRRQ
jgi:hypothetical protein